ncbi:MAG: DUF2300 domain-containing protein, partial [Azoarcus sp.]|nr:DUF2300 domain-containing protein [Azoarcus sp.]
LVCGPGAHAAGAGGALPALEVLWNGNKPGELEWRAFDASGEPRGVATVFFPRRKEDVSDKERPSALGPHAARAPLGSLWKLFVYLWLREERRPAPDYVCTGARGASAAAREHRAEEAYCCAPGQTIGRDAALLRSCGLFFAPARLGIDPLAWRRFWEARPGVRDHAPWLAELAAMKPETVVSPASILDALAAAPARAREDAANVLLARLFSAGAAPAPAELARGVGSQLRVKTFSWHRPGKPGHRYGGGAGWLGDGRPVWFAGEGTGQQVMSRHGAALAAALSGTLAPENTAPAPGCVRVNFFARYPFTLEQAGGKPAAAGILHGRHAARFQNGVSIPVIANGELRLTREDDGRERLEGRFGLDDYVARVIEREADATQTEAARALAVVIRSYLLNEAKTQGNCLAIDDSSRAQRVSPNPPGPAARAAAGFSAGLVLVGAPAGYHGHTPSKNRMAWTAAVAASRAGEPWDVILRKAFPDAGPRAMHDPAGMPCQPFTEAETWLAARAPQWHRILQERLRGFEPPPAPRVCLLPYGTPFSEQDRNRIHVRGLRTLEDRLALTHEYLHLGLHHHPSGHDEALIERWARALTLGEPHETALFR